MKFHNCQVKLCVDNRAKSLTIEKDGCIEEDAIVKELFLCEHLFWYHFGFLYSKPLRSKLDEWFFCSDDLAKLVRRTVNKALKTPKGNIKCHHVQPRGRGHHQNLLHNALTKVRPFILILLPYCQRVPPWEPQKRSGTINIRCLSFISMIGLY